MAEGLKVGDWISYSVSGLEDQGKVVGFDGESYAVRPKGSSPGQVTVVGKDGVKKIPPPEEERRQMGQ